MTATAAEQSVNDLDQMCLLGPVADLIDQMLQRLTPNGGRLRQHDTELREQAADAVDAGRALLDETLAHPVQAQHPLLLQALDGHKTHLGALHRLTDGGGICGIVLASLAREAVGHDELGGDQAHRVAMLDKQPGPVVCARAGPHADGAGWQGCNEIEQLGACYAGAHQCGLAAFIHPMQGEHGLGEIDADIDNSHGLPLPDELMKSSHFPSWHSVAVSRKQRLVRDGEVPFIR